MDAPLPWAGTPADGCRRLPAAPTPARAATAALPVVAALAAVLLVTRAQA